MGKLGAACAALISALLLAGCAGTGDEQFADIPGFIGAPGTRAAASTQPSDQRVDTQAEILHVGDALTINFSDLPFVVPPYQERVKSDGTITLLQNQTFEAAGKARGELEREIRARYVPKIFKNLTVTIQPQDRFYFVGGEVKAPGRQIYLGPITVTRAIQSCGDFTDFANKKKVKLIHTNGKIQTVNCVKALDKPSLDLPVYPGDKIYVPRRLF